MNAVAEKFEQFEWLTHGITAKSPQFNDETKGTGEKPLDYQDRLGAIASMETQLEKSITSVIIFGQNSKSDFEFVQNHLAKIMIANALSDKRREPEGIQLDYLAMLIARMVIIFLLIQSLRITLQHKVGCIMQGSEHIRCQLISTVRYGSSTKT